VNELKFRLKTGPGSVSGFRMGSRRYLPGDEVDLPPSYEGAAWLERVDPTPLVVSVPGKLEPVKPESVPLEASGKKKRVQKVRS
jgi:hypothetical protein